MRIGMRTGIRTIVRVLMRMMARINISVPDELKARMDACGESLNWSQVATAAFEEALDRLSSQDREGVSKEIAEALKQAPGVAVEVLGRLLGTRFPQLGHGLTQGLRPVVERLAAAPGGAQRPPEAAIDDLRAQLGAEVILLRLELLEKRGRRMARRQARRGRGEERTAEEEEARRQRRERRHRRRLRGDGKSEGDGGNDDEPLAPV